MAHSPSPSLPPPLSPAGSVAVIGGGIAGLACARTLAEAGAAVTVFDKGRGPGGRTSTRRFESLRFDHGAQYFTARQEPFQAQVEEWVEAGVAAPWRGRVRTLENGLWGDPHGPTVRYVGVPGMSALTRHLGRGLDVRYGQRVTALGRGPEGRWHLRTEVGPVAESFAAAVVAVPAPQAVPLLGSCPAVQARVSMVEMAPTIAVMVAFAEPLDVPADGAFVSSSLLSWIARDSSKPGRPSLDCWVLHATADWSAAHVEYPPKHLAPDLFDAFSQALGRPLPPPIHLRAHRWRYARATRPLEKLCFVDSPQRLAVCGDWCPGERIEGAYLSGLAAAHRLLPSLAAVAAVD